MLPMEVRTQIINDLDSDTPKGFLKVYAHQELAEIVNQLDSDDAADILNELPVKQSEEVLAGLDPLLRSQVIDLLRYDDHVAGGIMAKELSKGQGSLSVVPCVDEMRKKLAEGTK